MRRLRLPLCICPRVCRSLAFTTNERNKHSRTHTRARTHTKREGNARARAHTHTHTHTQLTCTGCSTPSLHRTHSSAVILVSTSSVAVVPCGESGPTSKWKRLRVRVGLGLGLGLGLLGLVRVRVQGEGSGFWSRVTVQRHGYARNYIRCGRGSMGRRGVRSNLKVETVAG